MKLKGKKGQRASQFHRWIKEGKISPKIKQETNSVSTGFCHIYKTVKYIQAKICLKLSYKTASKWPNEFLI